ncbi:MAG: alkaline phosphatase [Cyclobacteriaceae bacterium]
MNRREFFKNGALTTIGLGLISPVNSATYDKRRKQGSSAKNIIFLVSDGMSTGTLNMTDLMMQRQFGRQSSWMQLYREHKIPRALMDTASANSLITDSAAGSSSWGGGMRVNNGSLNMGPKGEIYKPILQKFKEAGKSVGCVTTVPISHATPAGFCINHPTRNEQDKIVEKYLALKFDVMMGGGSEFFDKDKREDGKDMFAAFKQAGFHMIQSKKDLSKVKDKKPVMGIYHEDGLPYSLDMMQDEELKANIPTLAEMTSFAIDHMKNNPKGFVMQVEGGKVDWAAHANDIGGLIYDQIAFDEAIQVAVDFAMQDKETLVIITTDHGNANPGLFSDAQGRFDNIQQFTHTNEWVLTRMSENSSVSNIREVLNFAHKIDFKKEDAEQLYHLFKGKGADGFYNADRLPLHALAQMQTSYTGVGWAGTGHSADFVELAMLGPGSEMLNPFIRNTELHNFMLEAAEIKV